MPLMSSGCLKGEFEPLTVRPGGCRLKADQLRAFAAFNLVGTGGLHSLMGLGCANCPGAAKSCHLLSRCGLCGPCS